MHSNFYSIVNKILSSESMQEAQKTNRSIIKLLSSLDTFSQNIETTDQTFTESNLAVSIVHMPNNRPKPIIGFAFGKTIISKIRNNLINLDPITNQTSPINAEDVIKNSTVIMLDSQAISQQNRLIFSVYNHRNGLFDEKQYRVLTRVISLTIDKPELTQNLGAFVKINFYLENNFQENNTNITCAYYQIFENKTARWSTEGCDLIDITDRNVMCECNHLTHFAILMDIEQKPIPKIVDQVLSIITLIGLLLSSIGLCLTILTFILFK